MGGGLKLNTPIEVGGASACVSEVQLQLELEDARIEAVPI
jgi:hypothetical protein